MEINKKKLQEKIIMSKKMIASMYHFEDINQIGKLEIINQEICLVVADFKCQKCGCENNLQSHHLILRWAKNFMDFFRYASQRYYWANQIILCNKCHRLYHRLSGEPPKDMLCIEKNKIKKIKKKYGINS